MRAFRILIFLCTVLTVLALAQGYIGVTVYAWLLQMPLSPVARHLTEWSLLALLIFLNLAIPIRMFFRAELRKSPFLRRVVLFPGFTWLLTSLWMSMLLAVKDVFLWVLSVLPARSLAENPAILHTCNAAAIGTPLIMAGYGALKTARDYKIERINIEFENLPSGLKGFTVAQISDIHSGMYMSEREMNKILELVNALNPNLAVLTGDYVDTRAAEIGPVARVFSKIRSDYGVFACMGNHDLFDDYSKISAAMKESGITMLENSNRTLKVNGEDLNLLGVGDRDRHYDLVRLDRAIENLDPDGFKILLAHRPNMFSEASAAGIDLQLSGHTHGGQVGIKLGPIFLNPVSLVEKYTRGHYRSGKSHLYVNPGVGMVFAPVRISVQPEITLITLS